MKDEFLTIQEAASFFRVTTRTLRRWEDKGFLTAQRTLGNQRRYSKVQLAQLLGPASIPTIREIPEHKVEAPTPQPSPVQTSIPVIETPNHIHGFKMPEQPSKKVETHLPHGAMVLGGAIAVIFFLTLTVIGFSNGQGIDEKRIAFINLLRPNGQGAQSSGGSVLATTDRVSAFVLKVNVPAIFSEKVTLLDAFEIKNSLKVDRQSNLFGGIDTNNSDINAGTGQLTASNVIYSILAGTNITIAGDPQNPTISANGGVNSIQGQTGSVAFSEGTGIGLDGLQITNTGVLSLQGQSGAVNFSEGTGIGLDGLTITNSDPGSAQKIFGTVRVGSTDITAGSNTDTLTFTAGSGITLTPDAGNKTLTITSDAAGVLSGMTTNGVLYATSSTTATSTNAGANGFILKSNGAGAAPEWVAPGTVLGFVPFDFITSGTNTAATMVIGSGASLGYTGTGTINASSLLNSTWVAPGAIGSTTPNTGAFTTLTATTLNGLTVTANGSNTLTIATGKTITLNNSLSVSGTDGTAFVFPSASGTLVSRDSTDTLTNKTIAAGSNTITGLTNANLSGTAGITNANLANSSVTVTAGTGLSGGGVVSLGGSVALNNAGVISATGGTGITIDTATGDITITNAGVTSLAGTANQVAVSGGTGSVTLSLPQNIHTAATPTFAGMTLSSFVTDGGLLYANGAGSLAQSSTLFAGTNGLGIGSSAIGNAKLVINQENASGDIFSASSSGTTRLTLSNTGNLNLTGTYYANGAAGITQGSASCVTTTNGIVTGFGTCQLGSEQWEIANGAIYTGNPSLDLILGGTSTDSAKFAVINISGGTPTATISAETGDGAAYLAGDGVLGTTNAQTLTIGSVSTGNVVIDAGSGSILLSDPTTVNGGVNLSLGNGYSINGTSVLHANTLGTNVVNSSLTQVGALASGSIASGFGTISIGNNITTTATVQGGTVNSTGALQTGGTNRIDASGNLVNIAALTASGTITLSGLSTGVVKSNASGILSSSAVGLNTSDVTGTLAIGNGGTGLTTTPTNGQLLIGNGTGYTLAGLTGGTAISIGNAAGAITINNTGVTSAVAGTGIGVSGATGAVTFTNTGVTSLAGTANQISVSGGTGAVTLSLPQDINIAASPTFAGLTLSTLTANGGLLYTNGSGTVAQTIVGSLGQCLTSNGGGAPTWSTCAAGQNLWQSNNGTVSPFSNTLDLLVGGTSTASAKFAFLNNLTGTPTASVSAGATGATYLTADGIVQTTANQSLSLGGNTTGNILFNSDGSNRVGIGTAAPGATLDVNGNLMISGSGRRILADFSNATIANRTLFQSSVTNDITSMGIIPNGTATESRMSVFNAADPDNASFLALRIEATRAILSSAQIGSGATLPLAFEVGFGSANEVGRFDTSGRFGVGALSSTTFDSRLYVQSTDQEAAKLYRNSTNSGDEVRLNFAVSSDQAFEGGYVSGVRRVADSGGLDLAFGTNTGGTTPTERLRITGTGTIGVGTTNPLATLDVRGQSGTLPIASFSAQTSNAGLIVDNNGVGDLFTASKSGATKFTILNNGNIRINNLNTASCDVKADTTGLLSCGTDAGATATTLQTAYDSDVDGSDAIISLLAADDSLIFRNPASGGTDSTFLLNLDQLSTGAKDALVINSAGANANFGFRVNDDGTSTDSTPFVIDNAGNVGIGTTAPAGTLEVANNGASSTIYSSSYFDTNGSFFIGRRARGSVASPTVPVSGNTLVNLSGSGYTGSGFGDSVGGLIVSASETFSETNQGTNIRFFTTPLGSTTVQTRVTITSEGDLIVGNDGINTAANIGGNGILAYGAICADDTLDTADDCIDNARTAGTVYGIASSFTIDDIAENFPTLDNNLEAGDIVMLDYQPIPQGANDSYEAEFVKKANVPYGSKLLGAVSEKPGVLLGGHGQNNDPRSVKEVAIGLSGRIPVKVTTQNGSIEPGDLITASAVPGAGMKATQAGFVIGRALEPYDNADPNAIGQIMVFINSIWYNPSVTFNKNGNLAVDGYALSEGDLPEMQTVTGPQATAASFNDASAFDPAIFSDRVATTSALNKVQDTVSSFSAIVNGLTARITSLENLASGSAFFTAAPESFTASSSAELALDTLDVTDATVSNTLAVLGRTTLSDVGITGRVNIGLLSIDGLNDDGLAAINTSAGALKLQSNGLNGIDILGGKITIDTKGNLETEGEITAKKINIDTQEVASASLGEVVLKSGLTKVVVTTRALTTKSKIFVQVQEIPLSTGVKKIGVDTFEIRIRSAEPSDLRLDWWIVN